MEKIINNLPIDFFFLTVDQNLDIKCPKLKNFYSIFDPNLSQKNSGFLLSQPSTIDYIKKITTISGHQAAIIPFKPSAKIDILCKQNNWILVSNLASLNRLLEDKIKFPSIVDKIPHIPYIIAPYTKQNIDKLFNKYGPKIIAQTHFGWAGNSTKLIQKYDPTIIPNGILCKFTPFLKGYTLLNNCCMTTTGLLQSPPALQFTGLKEYTNNPFATVGRQWPSNASIKITKQVKEITIAFGKILKKLKYRGFFGLDFFVSKGKVYLLECNPRLTASFAFYTEIELKADIIPLFYYHLLEFTSPQKIISEKRFDNKKIVGSELTKRDKNGVIISKEHNYKINV
ncbi:MAG: ATP-grasp domain-containing protein [Candidatus Shapirobacteria bacterium]